jgi:hypothetical protein
MSKIELQLGMPIILIDAKGLEKHPVWKGQEGMANSIINIEGISYVYFMPDNSTRMYVVRESKVKINEEKIEAWLEANK